MIDRLDDGSAIGSELLRSSDRLFHWWHKYRDGEMAWGTFLGYARPIRWGVRQALGRGVSCPSEKTAATCRMLLEGEEHLWTFLRVRGIEPTNNAAERALRHAVLWRKSSGGTASEWGSRFVERVLSVAATCRQQGRNVLEFLTDCFRAHVTGGPLPSLLVSILGSICCDTTALTSEARRCCSSRDERPAEPAGWPRGVEIRRQGRQLADASGGRLRRRSRGTWRGSRSRPRPQGRSCQPTRRPRRSGLPPPSGGPPCRTS